MSEQNMNRRKFLSIAGATGLGLGIAACATPPVPNVQPTAAAVAQGLDVTPTPDPAQVVADMDSHHEQGVTDFVNNLGKNNSRAFGMKMLFCLRLKLMRW